MAVTSGFFNSINGDRKYNAEQMSAIFDGIINDGVFANIGTAFGVKSSEGNTVNVGIGRAWFNSTWIYNDAILPIKLDDSELVLDRIDAIIVEVDRTNEVRNGSIKALKGTPGSSPQNPEMTSTDYVHQYPLAFILRKAGSTTITQGNITSMIGTSSCPYITGILQVQNIDNIVAQWQAQWIEWLAFETGKTEEEANKIIAEWSQWYLEQTTAGETNFEQWQSEMKSAFNTWFNGIQGILDGDAAAKISAEILDIQKKFDTLASQRCIYTSLEDSNGDPIKDNAGDPIEGKVVFGSDGNGNTEHYETLIQDLRRRIQFTYRAFFLAEGWSEVEGSKYSQTVILEPIDGGPEVVPNSIILPGVGIDGDLPEETKAAIRGPGWSINKAVKVLGTNTMTVTMEKAPVVDVELFFQIKRG